jgi:hypothetical protein
MWIRIQEVGMARSTEMMAESLAYTCRTSPRAGELPPREQQILLMRFYDWSSWSDHNNQSGQRLAAAPASLR